MDLLRLRELLSELSGEPVDSISGGVVITVVDDETGPATIVVHSNFTPEIVRMLTEHVREKS